MFQRTLLVVIVYAVFNLATTQKMLPMDTAPTLNASPDPMHDQKLDALVNCLNNLNTADDKDKIICHNVTDFENEIISFKGYLSKTHGNKSINENREYIKTIISALMDKDHEHVVKNAQYYNVTKAKECSSSRYAVQKKLTPKMRLFNKKHEINRRRNLCHDSEKINACILKNAFPGNDNVTIAYFKRIMDDQEKACSAVMDNPNTGGDNMGGLKTTLASIFMTLLTVLL